MAVLPVIAVMLAIFMGDVLAVTDQEFQALSTMVISQTAKIIEMEEQLKAERLIQNDCSTVIISQAAKIIKLEKQLKAALGPCRTGKEPVISELVQNRTIEERVALLEFQMTEVQVDADKIEMDVDIYKGQTLGLEQKVYSFKGIVDDHEARITSTEGDAADLQKVNRSVSELEERMETIEGTAADHEARITSTEGDAADLQKVNRSVSELEERVETLEGTAADHEARTTSMETDVEELQRADINHDARITALAENSGENETIAFHAVLASYSTIPINAAVKFDTIVLNEGNCYDSTTGIFTVPPGGDGLYYFSTYLLVDDGDVGNFEIQLNDEVICTAFGDHNSNGAGDYAQAMCSAVVSVVEGDKVKLVYQSGSDTTPLHAYSQRYYSGFNGFRL